MLEYLCCENCYRPWTRTRTRGRKPSLCPRCKPVPAARRKPVSAAVQLVGSDSKVLAGRPVRETNDCTVRTMAIATGRPYPEAHAWLAKAGRRNGRGVPFASVIRRAGHAALGTRFDPVPVVRSKGLRTFLLRNPGLRRGTYVLHCTKHVCVLKNGKILDSFDSSRKVFDGCWKVSSITGA